MGMAMIQVKINVESVRVSVSPRRSPRSSITSIS